MKPFIQLLSFLLLFGIIASCTYSSTAAEDEVVMGASKLSEQFRRAQFHTKGQDLLFLETIQKIDSITSYSDLEKVIQVITDDSSVIISDIREGLYDLTCLGVAKSLKNNIGTIVRDKVRIGMNVYILTWNYRGAEYESVAVGTEEGGIAYDNIGYLALSFNESADAPESTLVDSDTLAMDPNIMEEDTCAVDSQNRALFLRDYECSDRFGIVHGHVILGCRADFFGSDITAVSYTNDVYYTEQDAWIINSDIVTLDGGISCPSITFAWYYSLSSTGCAATLTGSGFLLPTNQLGVSGVFTMNSPGSY